MYLDILILPALLYGENLRFDSPATWEAWNLPLGNVEFTPTGGIKPRHINKDINASLNAVELGGGIRNVGSNAAAAALILDGDQTTGWSPLIDAPVEDWFVEIDLGRAVAASKVTLLFDQEAPPFELFDLDLSTGELPIDVVGKPTGEDPVYRIRERF